MKILITGGLGYIGSHLTVLMNSKGFEVIILDNLANSDISTLEKINNITGKNNFFIEGDLSDESDYAELLNINKIDTVIHLAGYKSVSESLKTPLEYYRNNLIGTLNLLNFTREKNINKFVFSSSATVYGDKNDSPIKESGLKSPINPYGDIKLQIEKLLETISFSSKNFSCVSLRYFNPVGSDKSGLLGDNPKNKSNNIMPILMNVAIKKEKLFYVYGKDYKTHDGTCIRDYIHVMDVAEGHISALKYLKDYQVYDTFNLGTGRGHSVLELIDIFETECDVKIPITFVDKRHGDIPICFADVNKAKKKLNWQAKRDLRDMCKSAWKHKLILGE